MQVIQSFYDVSEAVGSPPGWRIGAIYISQEAAGQGREIFHPPILQRLPLSDQIEIYGSTSPLLLGKLRKNGFCSAWFVLKYMKWDVQCTLYSTVLLLGSNMGSIFFG